MGGSGGGGGGGYAGGSYTPSGGPGGGGAGGSGSGGDNGGGDKCIIALNTSLSSPNATVVQALQTGNILPLVLQAQGATFVTQVLAPSGAVVGSIAGIPNLRNLIDCMNNGHDYVFVVSAINGGRVDGRLRNA